MTRKSILIALFFVLLSGIAFAQDYQDFNFFGSTQKIDACMCGEYKTTFLIENTGKSSMTFEISQSGTGAELSELEFTKVRLNSGAKTEVTSTINALCGEKGDRTIKTRVRSEQGLVKEISQVVSTKNCVNIKILNPEFQKTSCQCKPTIFEFNLSNPGVFTETYSISVNDEFKDYSLLNANTVTIKPGKGGIVYLQVTPPCEAIGPQNLSLIVKAKTSKFVAKKPFFLDINNCYNYTFNPTGLRPIYDAEGNYLGDVPSDEPLEMYTACLDSETSIPVILKNTGESANNYTINADELPAWANVDINGTFSLKVGESKTFKLLVSPSTKGLENISITALSSIGQVEQSAHVPLEVKECYAFDMTLDKTEDEICCLPEPYTLEIFNTGAFSEGFTITTQGPEWATLSTSQVVIDPNSSAQLTLTAQPPCDLAGTENIIVQAQLDRPGINMSKTAELALSVVNQDWCVYTEITDVQFVANTKANTYFGEYEIPLKIYNQGIKPQTYFLSLEAPEWMEITPDIVTLSPKESSIILLRTYATTDSELGVYNIKITAEPEDLDSVYVTDLQIKLKHYTSWDQFAHSLDQHMVLYIIIMFIVLAIIFFLVFKPGKKGKDEKDQVFDIEEDLELIEKPKKTEARITAKKKLKDLAPPSKPKSSAWKTWVSVIVVVIILALITAYFLSLPPAGTTDEPITDDDEDTLEIDEEINETPIDVVEEDEEEVIPEDLPPESFTYMLFNEEETRIIDLNDHFYDPDSDELTFGYTETENFNVDVDAGRVTMTPKAGFVGEEEIVFFAQDTQGGRISSPPVTLRALEGSPIVREEVEEDDAEPILEDNEYSDGSEEEESEQHEEEGSDFKTYMFYIVLGIVLLIIIVMILEFSSKKKQKDPGMEEDLDLEEELAKK